MAATDCRARMRSIASTYKSMWKVLFAGGIYSFMLFDEADIFLSYLRTAVSCNITGEEQGELQTSNWSGSNFCFDRNYVIGEATRNQGWLTAMGYALKICSVFFLGIVADTSGRRVVMIVGSVAMCVSFGLLALNRLINGGASLALIAVASVIQGLTNPASGGASPFVTAMIADLSAAGTRGLAMTNYAAVRTFFSIAAFGLGYYILTLELTDYSLVWASFAALAAVDALLYIFLVPETLGQTGSDDDPIKHAADTASPPTVAETGSVDADASVGGCLTVETKGCDTVATSNSMPAAPSRKSKIRTHLSKVHRVPFAQAIRNNPCAGFCIVWRSPFLRLFIISTFLMYTAFGGTYLVAASYLMAQMQWTQANASLALVSQSFATIAGYILNYWVVTVVAGEAYACFGIGVGAACVGNLIVGLLSPTHVAGFWVGFMTVGIAYGFALPALPTIASKHADPEEQAQLQSTFTVATMIGLVVASEAHTNMYDENSSGLVSGAPFYLSASILAVALTMHVVAYQCCRRKTSIGKRTRGPSVTSIKATTRITELDEIEVTDTGTHGPPQPESGVTL